MAVPCLLWQAGRPAFSTAANKTIAQTSNAYDAVNQIYFDAEAETLVATFDTEGFHPDKIKPFIPAKDLEVRTKVLKSLKQYADLLAEIAGDKAYRRHGDEGQGCQ